MAALRRMASSHAMSLSGDEKALGKFNVGYLQLLYDGLDRAARLLAQVRAIVAPAVDTRVSSSAMLSYATAPPFLTGILVGFLVALLFSKSARAFLANWLLVGVFLLVILGVLGLLAWFLYPLVEPAISNYQHVRKENPQEFYAYLKIVGIFAIVPMAYYLWDHRRRRKLANLIENARKVR